MTHDKQDPTNIVLEESFHVEFTQATMQYEAAVESVWLEHSLRTYAQPPIKGKITNGKVKWRGIKIRQRNAIDCVILELEQRGKIIGVPLCKFYRL